MSPSTYLLLRTERVCIRLAALRERHAARVLSLVLVGLLFLVLGTRKLASVTACVSQTTYAS